MNILPGSRRNLLIYGVFLVALLTGYLLLRFSGEPITAATLLKDAGYLCVLVGLLGSMCFALRRAGRGTGALSQANRETPPESRGLDQTGAALHERRRTLHLVISSMPNLLLLADEHNRLIALMAPPHFPRILKGYEDVLGKPLVEVLPDELIGPALFPSILDRVRETEETHSSEHLLTLADGGTVYLKIRVLPVVDSPDVLVIADDITELKLSARALQESEERYRSLFEDSPISLWEEDFSAVKEYVDGLREAGVEDLRAYFHEHPEALAECVARVRILDVNNATLALHEAETKEEILQGLGTILREESLDTLLEQVIAIAEGQTRFETHEAVNYTLRGKKLFVSLRWHVAPGHEQTYSKVLLSIVDITERKRAEMELQAQRDFALHVMNTMGQGLTVTDEEGQFEYVNPAFARMLGYLPEELIGKTPYDVTVPEDRPVLDQAYVRRRRGETSTYDLRLRRADGSEIYALITGVPLWRAGKMSGTIAVVTDMTERKQMEEALARAHNEALEASRLKSRFLANMSHELRTPLNSIIGLTQILVDGIAGELNEQQHEFLCDILSSSEHLLGLINDVLDMSKIEAGRMDIHPQPFDFEETAREVVETVAILVEDKGQHLETDIAPDLPPLNADRMRIKQVLLNLLSNAHKFTPAGGRISLRARLVGQRALLVSVSDSGIGIAPENIPTIFQEFRQVGDSSAGVSEGTGLGLPISRRLIEMHGGVMWVESEPGQGSTFSLLLPLEGPPETPARVVLESEFPRLPPLEERGPLALVVASYRMGSLLAFHLGRAGFDTAHLLSSEKLVEHARLLKPFVIVLGDAAQGAESWLLLSRLQNTPETAHIPLLILDASFGQNDAELTATGHLVKPLSIEEAQKALEGSRPADAPLSAFIVSTRARAEHLFRSAFPCTPCEVRVFSPPEDVEQRDWVAPDILILDAAISGADAVRWLAQAHPGPADRAGDRVSPLVLLAGDWPEQGNNRPWFAEVRTVACKALSQESSLLECLRELRITPTSQVARPATPPTEVLSHD